MTLVYPLKKYIALFNVRYSTKFKISSCITKAYINIDKNSLANSYVTFTYNNNSKMEYTQEFFDKFLSHSMRYRTFISFVLEHESKTNNIKIEVWPPTKIHYAYLEDNYFSSSGTIGSSCMRHKKMQRALNFYKQNDVHIVVAVDNKNKIHARALLWKNVKNTKESNKTYIYLDRVYYRTEQLKQDFIKFARENKWYSYNIKYSEYAYIDNINIKGIYYLPYADTFRGLFYKDGILTTEYHEPKSLLKYPHNKSLLMTTSADGYHKELDPNYIVEVFTNIPTSKKDAVYVKQYDGYIQKKHVVNIKGKYYSQHDANNIILSPIDKYILKKDSVKEAITDEIIDKNNATKVFHYKKYVHNTNLINCKGVNYHKKDKDIVVYSDNYYHISECVSNYICVHEGIQFSWKPAEGETIPTKHAMIVYDIIEKVPACYKCKAKGKNNDVYNNSKTICPLCLSEYHNNYTEPQLEKKYVPDTYTNYITLITGERIRLNAENRKLLKKFNKKYYIRSEFELPDKNQLLLFK